MSNVTSGLTLTLEQETFPGTFLFFFNFSVFGSGLTKRAPDFFWWNWLLLKHSETPTDFCGNYHLLETASERCTTFAWVFFKENPAAHDLLNPPRLSVGASGATLCSLWTILHFKVGIHPLVSADHLHHLTCQRCSRRLGCPARVLISRK